MNLRCMYCQTMFGLSRESMLIGLQAMEADKLDYYEFHCPKCRRANRVERKKLELANPNWQETVKEMAKEAAKEQKAQAKADKSAAEAASPAAEKKPATKKTAAKAKGK
jgi:phage FluMu protein Com